jgi:phosphopentomutase
MTATFKEAMMGNFLVIVLDGFGVGQMPDVLEVRPTDIGANTCEHIFDTNPGLALPNLAKLGLANVVGKEYPGLPYSKDAVYGKSKLMHQGADTFFGHQEIMGTKPPQPKTEAIQSHVDDLAAKLKEAGFTVHIYTDEGSGLELLIVNEAVTVADNVECDPGQAWNVTAAIDDVDFETELKIGRIVRSVAKIPRVIVFGGRQVHLPNLLAAIEVHGDLIGVNAPKSGVYVNDYHCIHMGYGVDEKVQVPYILGKHGIDVHLLGKVADVCANKFGESESIVDTAEVLARTFEALQSSENTFICTNVQETDLCGHRQDSKAYADKLRIADEYIGKIRSSLKSEDYMIVMADHGNDPTIGHPHHTREYVPLLISHVGTKPTNIGTRDTESDVGATVADFFGVEAPQNGTSFLPLIRS